jgi:succinate-semialdehyde dehydrogenase/glutarate-semialdehyde dehydrogenase
MLKHSSTTPLCSLAIQRLFNDAGFDRGEYQNVFLDINQVQALIEDPRMRAIKFIGH